MTEPMTKAGREMAGVLGDTPTRLEWANHRIALIEAEAVGPLLEAIRNYVVATTRAGLGTDTSENAEWRYLELVEAGQRAYSPPRLADPLG